MTRLAKKIARQAKGHGICRNWHQLIRRAKDVDTLLNLYTRGIDFCLDNNFPSNKTLQEYGKEKLEEYGIFVDKQIRTTDPARIVALGRCNIDAAYTTSGHEVFLKHKSKAQIHVGGDALVVIDAFDNAVLQLSADKTSRVLVALYGNAKVICNNQANIRISTKYRNNY